MTSQVESLKKKNHALKMQVHHLKKKLDKVEMPPSAKNTSPSSTTTRKRIEAVQTTLTEFLPEKQVDFVMSQIRSATRKAKCRRWTYKDKAFALSLLHSSPKTYHLLDKVFALPSV